MFERTNETMAIQLYSQSPVFTIKYLKKYMKYKRDEFVRNINPISRNRKLNYMKRYNKINWRKYHNETDKIRIRYYMRNKRLKLFDILGYKICLKCGCNEISKLVFDHINNNGNVDRARFKSNPTLYSYYIKNPIEAKSELQVLCASCNLKKEVERNHV